MRDFNYFASQTFHSAKGEESIFPPDSEKPGKISSGNETKILKCHVVHMGSGYRLEQGTRIIIMLSVWA